MRHEIWWWLNILWHFSAVFFSFRISSSLFLGENCVTININRHLVVCIFLFISQLLSEEDANHRRLDFELLLKIKMFESFVKNFCNSQIFFNKSQKSFIKVQFSTLSLPSLVITLKLLLLLSISHILWHANGLEDVIAFCKLSDLPSRSSRRHINKKFIPTNFYIFYDSFFFLLISKAAHSRSEIMWKTTKFPRYSFFALSFFVCRTLDFLEDKLTLFNLFFGEAWRTSCLLIKNLFSVESRGKKTKFVVDSKNRFSISSFIMSANFWTFSRGFFSAWACEGNKKWEKSKNRLQWNRFSVH